MIYSLNGILEEVSADHIVVSCGGVGYYLLCSANTAGSLPQRGERVFVYTVMNIRENAVELCGFASEQERDMYKMLCTVSGVGPKVAMGVLSTFTPDRLALLIASEDFKSITASPGVGQRTAQRIVVELKDKVGAVDTSGQASAVSSVQKTSGVSEAVEALAALGFSVAEASRAVAAMDTSLPTEAIIAGALRKLAKG